MSIISAANTKTAFADYNLHNDFLNHHLPLRQGERDIVDRG